MKWGSELIDDFQTKVNVMIGILIVDLRIETGIIRLSSAKWLCEIHDTTMSNLVPYLEANVMAILS